MEGIFIMLLYLIAGFFKNRRDKAKRDKIQSDPNWEDSKSSNDLNFNFENIFKEIAGDSIKKNKNEIDQSIAPSEIVNQKICEYQNSGLSWGIPPDSALFAIEKIFIIIIL